MISGGDQYGESAQAVSVDLTELWLGQEHVSALVGGCHGISGQL
jgi:hypothetical protein